MPTPTATRTDRDPAPYVRAIATRSGLPVWLDWRVTISARRRTSVGATIDPAGTNTGVKVTFQVPVGMSVDDVLLAVSKMRPKLTATAADVREHGAYIAVKDLVSGEGFTFVGTHYRLKVTDQAAHSIEDGPGPSTWSGVRTWQLTLRRSDASARTIIEWYKARGRMWLDRTVPAMAARLGIPAGLSWEVTPDNGRSWACYHHNTRVMSVSWVVFQMPRQMIETILWHELAHDAAGERGHGPAWERAFARVLPDWRERNQAARTADGLTLWLGEVSHATVTTVPLHTGPMPGTADNGVRIPADVDPGTWTTAPARRPADDGVSPTWSPATDTGATFVRYAQRPRVGDHVATGSHGHGVCPVAAVRDYGRELTITIPGGKRRKITRDHRGSWVVMAPAAPATDTADDSTTDPWGAVL